MARSSQVVQVGKRKIELSNLKKVLWPEDGVLKAELIQYYLTIAPTILAHIQGRPLSLVRFPDGIHGETFFQKNLPDWTPDWIESADIGDAKKSIRYFVPTEAASLVWLANLACIEMHQMHCRVKSRDNPDYFVFDIDPPDGTPWELIADTGLKLREVIEAHGYHTFVKTTGRKGLHVVSPIEPKWDFDTVFAATQAIAKPFVAANAKTCTLRIQKNQRDDKILIDIYRNRPSQTIVSAYSVRGLPGATVSMPLRWEQLHEIEGIRAFHIRNVPDIVKREGDVWEGMNAYAVELHTSRAAASPRRSLPKSGKYKTPDQLETYAKKRAFGKTPEPAPGELDEGVNRFVVHRHHASRLHYDLRLEMDGVLRSYAVPKGLPPRPGIKRLAVQTEDHPIEYLTFEGTIPKGEYGGGDMWVYASGRYEITKQKKDSMYVRLSSRGLSGEYRIIPTRNKENILERVDAPQTDWLSEPVEPMLAELSKEVPTRGEWIYEVKWDGIRAMVSLDEGVVRILSRNMNDITAAFPELADASSFAATCGLFDCEIVCLDPSGRPIFRDVINRMRQRGDAAERGRRKHPAVCYVFDCLYLDGRPLVNEPIERRREWMADAIKRESSYRVSQTVEDGEALFKAAGEMGLEGIMAKKAGSVYTPGRRNDAWLKIKTRNTLDCVVIGYTAGKGDRAATFGALHIAEPRDGAWHYLGKVGTGFDDKTLDLVLKALKKIPEGKRPIEQKPADDKETTWLEPVMWCEVAYGTITPNETLREPVFVRLRPDRGEA
ncbi:MAG: non-homologous end-joining DNA ligase [Candidatus Krumholzibacteria bacterium]|nr:non-homologous end-joining DNA ligase [Candidatus Krumholzibacteria bacterium]MDH4337391.1 non-homologous end-joining DNA ligase [Candidatus Krumholzibacteria bacterium]MDH5271028.1 non-homologous end-joining DNA ligase [Candidatus Krumholzibacteria bacterium]